MSNSRIVIDASVALKWFLRDEEATAQADALLDDILGHQVSSLTPTLFDYEITNALRAAVTRGRLAENEARDAPEKFQSLPINRIDFLPLQAVTYNIAVRYQRSAYDSACLALAQSLAVPFITGDKRLYNAVSQYLIDTKWIGDYDLNTISGVASESSDTTG